MVKKRIEKIKKALPEVEHVVLFYNNGLVFQSDFDRSVNIPKIGENLSEILSHMRSLYKVCSFNSKKFHKLLFETEDINVLILNIGENINVALFFRKVTELTDLNIKNIRSILIKIESLTDIGYIELEKKELDALEEKEEKITKKLDVLEEKEEIISIVIESHSKKKKDIEKNIEILEEKKKDIETKIEILEEKKKEKKIEKKKKDIETKIEILEKKKKEKIEEEKKIEKKKKEKIEEEKKIEKKKKDLEVEKEILEKKKKDIELEKEKKKEKIEELKEKSGEEEFCEDLD